jgi:hypothetical protein
MKCGGLTPLLTGRLDGPLPKSNPDASSRIGKSGVESHRTPYSIRGRRSRIFCGLLLARAKVSV